MTSRPELEPHAADPDDLVFSVLGGAQPDDPYPVYRALRENWPVHVSASTGVWFLTGYGLTKHVLHDPRFGRGNGSIAATFASDEVASRSGEMRRASRNMLFSDPPEHTRLRGLVSRAFTPRRVEGLRSSLEGLLEPLLDAVEQAGEVDLLGAVAFRFPVAVIGELVGVPERDRAQFRTLVRAGTAMIEAAPQPEALAEAEHAMREMTEYFRGLVAVRRVDPRDDLLSALIAIEDEDGDRLSEDELISTAILLFAAGFETTTNLIGNGMLCLLRHPESMDRLRRSPELVRSAVEEILRFESPVQVDARVALVDADVDGNPVAAGTPIVTLLGAANRDDSVYEDPERFDVERSGEPPLSFGWGIHHCLGAHLARLEGEIVFTRMLERFDDISLAVPEPAWRPGVTLRGLESLPVRVTTGGSR